MSREEIVAKIEACGKEADAMVSKMEQTTNLSEISSMLTRIFELKRESDALLQMYMAKVTEDYKKEICELTDQLTSDLMLERTEGF